MKANYPLVGQGLEYFIVDGHEWPTLLVNVARWLYENNACVQSISFYEQQEGESYVSATVQHEGTWIEQVENPMAVLDQLLAAVNGLATDLQTSLENYNEELADLVEENGL